MNFEQLVSAIIHDLKNQLQSLLAYEHEALEQIPTHYHQYLAPILQRTNRLKNDTLQLVTLFRLDERNHFPMDDAWPRDTAQEAIEATQLQFPHIEFDNQIDADSQGFYNDSLMHLALITLITNSAQAGATRICLEAEHDDSLRITITDDGPGFPLSVLQGQQDSNKKEGTGLGIYFVELIAEQHQYGEVTGYLSLQNLPSKGAKASLVLPQSL